MARIHSLPGFRSALVLLERLYVRALAALWKVDPAPLFDREYYLAENPEVCGSGMDPLFHFVRYGGAEGRNPHPLFDTKHYLDQYPDVKRSGHNPLLHFLRFGGKEGRSPHPDFDSLFYLASNPDVAAARVNPLVHFLMQGAAEKRSPHPEFDPALYLAAQPDIAALQVNPLEHFVKRGAAEGRALRSRSRINPPAADFLPVSNASSLPATNGEIDVVIPVYKGVAETEACLASVLASRCAARFRVVVINDSSPEPALTEHLRSLARDGRITLLENERNLGFVQSVNAGMRASGRDVVLLNSDTLVFNDWLDRLQACAYAEDRIGTVTPFTNNATICSYPTFCANNTLSPGTDMAALDATFASVNRGRSVDIPTAVGFCMYIRRECLEENGLFDAEAFGLGYGEENDFCMRIAGRGWKNRLACDVFVYHAGSVSFGPASARQQAAMRILVGRYPAYPMLVSRHVQLNPANAFRIAVTAQRIRKSGKRAVLAIGHSLGGGAAEHVRQIADLTSGAAVWLTLRPVGARSCVLECGQEDYAFSVTIDLSRERETLAAILDACGVARIEIHHLLGYGSDLAELVRHLGLPFDFTVHDYYTICPQVTLTDEHGRYCGEPADAVCNRCIRNRPPRNGLVDISSWRSAHAWALSRADRVIAPSADTAARIARHCPEARIVAAEHPQAFEAGSVTPRPLGESDPLRVAVIGTQTIHKGYELLSACADAAKNGKLPIEFTLIGSVETAVQRERDSFTATGRYQEADLPGILERVAPHLVWFPTRAPETFSYALSACLKAGLPVAAHNIGAFPERLGGRPWSWIEPVETSAAEWIEIFLRMRRDHFLPGKGPSYPPERERSRTDFYSDAYLRPVAVSGRGTTARPPRTRIRIAAAVSTDGVGRIQACGYVRLVQPLTHPAVAGALELAIRAPQDLSPADADIVVVQRVSIPEEGAAEELIEKCRRSGTRLVYETDDDLFHLPPEHPESRHYAAITLGAKRLAQAADAIVTSTEPLRERLLAWNRNVIVVPNYLDDRLWAPSDEPSYGPGPVRILYAGTLSHRDDLEFLGRAVRKMSRASRASLRIDVVGVTAEKADWHDTVTVPDASAVSYPQYVDWIRRGNVWHWGVAPLLDTPFNRSKSPLKFLEYAALGLPSICSDMVVYRDTVRSGQTGLLVSNDEDAWREALEMAAQDESLWRRLRGTCRQTAEENTIQARAGEIKQAWTSIAAASGAPTSAAPAQRER